MSTLRPGFAVRPLSVLAALLVVSALSARYSPAQSVPPLGDLPLKRVVLFTSGVGFFDRIGEVEGDARVRLSFHTDDVNDLLKSMVVQDFDGGRVGAITYGSQDPIARTLESFAIDLTEDASLVELLAQVRGERLLVEAPAAIEGVLVGVENGRETVVGGQKVEHDLLVMLTAQGLTRIPVDTIRRLRLLNPKLDAELRQALGVLARENVADRKTVTCAFDGKGRRRVRVAYIQQAPVWKTSYRLVLADNEPPFLQGWAMVENTTEEDWDRVQLTLVSGRPISFVMDLYAPIYLQRPVVKLETYASLRPSTHGRSRSGFSPTDQSASAAFFIGRKTVKKRAFAGPSGAVPPAAGKVVTRRAAGGGHPVPYNGPAGPVPPEMQRLPALAPDQGVESAASAAEVGELFQYAIDTPVTLARQRSAMLPILNAEIQGEKISIYNPAVHAAHPLNGFRLQNTSGLHLMQGPITVFVGGAYAGDARVRDVAAGESRLISYALDLDCEVRRERPGDTRTHVAARMMRGVLVLTHKLVRSLVYQVTNAGTGDKLVLIEHRRESPWTRTAPKQADDTTTALDRFRVEVAAGKTAKLAVVEERLLARSVQIGGLRDADVLVYLEGAELTEAMKAALTEVMRRRNEIRGCAEERRRLEQRVRTIDQERGRVAGIMRHLDRNLELYKRYLSKLTQLEDEMDEKRPKIETLAVFERSLQKQLEDYIAALDLE